MNARTAKPSSDEGFSDREYQVQGVRGIVTGLAGGGRGQLHAACGTGKTKIGVWSAERLVPACGVVVIVVPTVGLVAQTLREWRAVHSGLDVLAVCSDATVADEGADAHGYDGDAFGSVEDFVDPVTVDPDVVAAWLRQEHGSHLRLIVGTHVSAHVIGEGLQKARLVADLLIVDEAHRTAGRRDKRVMLVHDDDVLPAHRRLYMTATPRIDARGERDDSVSMDDQATFGPVLFRYPFSQAIREAWLDDYRLAVVGVTKAEVLAILRRAAERLSPHSPLPSEHAAMVQAAILRAGTRFGLRRVIAFCPRVADAQSFAETFPRTAAALPARAVPSRPLHATHIHGGMRQAERRAVLEALAHPPRDGWTVVSNARCLSEGIDVPSVDTVAFTAPKESTVEIVQAIGRALRRDPNGSGVATILVPILLSDTAVDDSASGLATVDIDSIDVGSFSVLWEVVNGLRAHDDRFDVSMRPTQARHYVRGATPDRIEAVLPPGLDEGDLLQHLGIYLVKAGSSRWWDGYHRLVEFSEREGHANPEMKCVEPDGFQLGQWVSRARTQYRKGKLDQDRVDALVALGVEFDDQGDARWWRSFQRLVEFKEREGHANPDHDFVEPDGFKLGAWATNARLLYRKRMFDQRRMNALEALGVSVDDRNSVKWWSHFERLVAFKEREGDANPSSTHVEPDGVKLGSWATRARMDYRKGILDARRVDALTDLGFVFEERTKTQWEQRWAIAAAYYAEHGNLDPPEGATYKGLKLLQWLRGQRTRHNTGQMSAEHAEKLERIGMQWRPQRPQWMNELPDRIQDVRDFVAEHGRLPETYSKDGELGALVQRLRRAHKSASLEDGVVRELTALGMDWRGPSAVSPKQAPVGPAERWWVGYRHLVALYEQRGDSWATQGHVTDDGYELGMWIATTRREHKNGKLSADQVDALKRVEFPFDPSELAWERAFGVAAAFSADHGHLEPTKRQVVDGVALGQWLYSQRKKMARGELGEDRVARLSALGMKWGMAERSRRGRRL